MPEHQETAGFVQEIREHIHSESLVFPTNITAPITLTDGGAANVYGAWVQVIAASTLSGPYDVHYVSLRNFSGNDVYRIQFGFGVIGSPTTYGEAGDFIRTAAITDFSGAFMLSGAANHALAQATDGLFARVKTVSGAGNTVDISVTVHAY